MIALARSFPACFQNRFLKTPLVSNFLSIGQETGNESHFSSRFTYESAWETMETREAEKWGARFHVVLARFQLVSKTVSLDFCYALPSCASLSCAHRTSELSRCRIRTTVRLPFNTLRRSRNLSKAAPAGLPAPGWSKAFRLSGGALQSRQSATHIRDNTL